MDNTVISESLLPLDFTNSDWSYTGWFLNGQYLSYIRGSKENSIKISKKYIDEETNYFLVINVGSLRSGNIILKNRNNDILLTIDKEGVTYLELYLDKPNYEELVFSFTSAFVESTATIKSIRFYKVTDRIKDYIAYVLSNKESYIQDEDELSSIYDPKLPGSTMTPNNVVSKRTTIQEIELNDNLINELSQNYLDSGIKSIPSSKALFDAVNNLKSNILSIDPHNNLFTDNTVVTLPLLPTTFEQDSDWVTYNWSINNGAIFYSGNDLKNYIKILPEFLTYGGYYFFVIEISRLDSGYIVLKNTKNEVIFTVDEIGTHYFEIYVPDANAETFTLEAVDVYKNEVVQITSVGFYRVTDRIRNYLLYFFTARESDDAIVTRKYLQQELNNLTNNLNLVINNKVQVVEDDLLAHIQNEDNPHNVTPAKIGAAVTNHTHTPISIGAADREHTHEPEECGAAPTVHTHSQYVEYTNLETEVNKIISGSSEEIQGISEAIIEHIQDKTNPHGVTKAQIGLSDIPNAKSDSVTSSSSNVLATSKAVKTVQDNLNIHIADKNNPHEVTVDQIGAALKNHTHTPESIGAAKTEHTHSEYLLKSDISSEVNSIVSDSLSSITTSINNHINDKDNPHEVTYTQVGAAASIHTHELGDVGPNGAADALHTHVEYTTYEYAINIANNTAEALIEEALFDDITTETDTDPVLVNKYAYKTDFDNLSDNVSSLSMNLNSVDNSAVHKTGNETIKGIKTFSSTISGSIDGNAATATAAGKLSTARTISLTGAVSGSANFDGSSNISISVTVVDNSHNHTIDNITNLQSILNTKAIDSQVVHNSGNETISGTKTFSSTISGSINGSSSNSTKWNGSSKTISTASPSGGSNGDIWFQYIN